MDALRRPPGHFHIPAEGQCQRCGVKSGNMQVQQGEQAKTIKATVHWRSWCLDCTPHWACEGCNNAHRMELGLPATSVA